MKKHEKLEAEYWKSEKDHRLAQDEYFECLEKSRKLEKIMDHLWEKRNQKFLEWERELGES